VPTVAAIVIAATSATGPGTARAREQRDDGGEGELPAGLAGRPRVERERDGGGEAERVPAVGRPARERGDEPGRTHHPGPLDRWPGSGKRHVERDERERDHETGLEANPGHRASREHEDGEQHHVLAADREHVSEAGALEVISDVLAESFVLAEDHPAQQRCIGRRQALRKRGLGAPARGVDRTERAAATLPGRSEPVDLDGHRRPAPALVFVEAPEGRDPPGHSHDLPDARPRPRPRGLADAQHGIPETGQPRPRHGRPARADTHRLEQHGACVYPASLQLRQPPTVERADAYVRRHRTRQDRRGRHEWQDRRRRAAGRGDERAGRARRLRRDPFGFGCRHGARQGDDGGDERCRRERCLR
jgi:hypothetical protein